MGHPVSTTTREKIRLANLGRKLSIEIKQKISSSNLGKHECSKENKEKIKQKSLAQWNNPESRSKLLKGIKNHSPYPPDFKNNCKLAHLGQYPTEACINANRARKGEKRSKYEIKNYIEYCETTRRLWKTESYVTNQMRARKVRQNKMEHKMEELLNKYFPSQWAFVGDGQFIIDGICPDFININGEKQVIELYGNYWHRGEDPQIRKDRLKRFGYACLVIWEKQLSNEQEFVSLVKSLKDKS